MASMNGCDSMSPIVPPISVMTTSASVFSARRWMRALISSVTWGMTCTVPPRKSPWRSRLMSVWYTEPCVTLLSRLRDSSMKRS